MGKPGLGLFTGRRKSTSNALEEMTATDTMPSPDGTGPADSGAFRLMSRTEVEKANERRKTMEREKSTSKFARFSSFGTHGKGRVNSFDDESPGSSKRDSKSSNGTQFSSARYYNNGQHGSTSTLPSSTDTSSDDNPFASAPRPPIQHQHSSSPSSSLSMNAFRKQLPSLPKTSSGVSHKPSERQGRERSMTTSSYASTAIPPKLEADLGFGNSTFDDDMFSGISRKESPPEMTREAAGRSLLSDKRTFQPEPIKIHPKLDVEAPLKSWDSRGSGDNLMSPHSDNDSPPPPPPPHKYSQYAPVASESPTLTSSATFENHTPQPPRKAFADQGSYRDSSPELQPVSISSSSANSFQTPASSRSSNYTNNATPKAPLTSTTSLYTDNEDENMFAPAKLEPNAVSKSAQKAPAAVVPEERTPTAATNGSRPVNGRVLTQTEYLAMQKRANSQPPPEDDSDEEDYEDEEDAIRKREEEEIMRRKQQQMHFAREAMRRTTTAPTSIGNHERGVEGVSMGFPSETSINADEWEDEDVPLGILAQHGFPSQARNRLPNQPANQMPSYIPDRPASAGALGSRGMSGALPAFARNLPADPHSSFIGGGLVQPMNRESMGFNGFSRGPMSVAGDSMAGGGMGMHNPMMYQEAGMSQPSLVDQIQMRDMTKQKYMGGASNKKPQGGPFTGMLGQQMNNNGQSRESTRMSSMPMNGNGMMNPMMGGQMPMMGMGMGMNQMGYPMPQGNDMMAMQQMQQMQQMIAMQQMQLQQMHAMQQQPMGMPNNTNHQNGYGSNMMGNGSFLNIPGAMPNSMPNRPMSFMSTNGAQRPQPPMSNFMGPGPGYTPSIAPSERSNIGLSARYRPVVNNADAHSTGTSTILQVPNGGSQNAPAPIKGIIKPARQAVAEEDEDWSQMAARKSKFVNNKQRSNGLEELTKGLNI